MVNSPHEAHHRAFQEIPELALRAFDLLGLPDCGPTSMDVLNCDVSEVKPVERRVDTLVRMQCTDKRSYVLAIEAQTKKDPDKARSWGYYLGFLANKYRNDVPMLLVLCRDKKTAEWAAGPFRIGHPDQPNVLVRPFVLGPGNVPVIVDIERAARDLELAVFSVLTHGDHPGINEILEVVAAALAKSDDHDRITRYADLIASGLGNSPAAEFWRSLVDSGLFELRGFVAEGLREEGQLRQQVTYLLEVLSTRGVPLTDAERERIATCRDSNALDQWFHRALTATTAQDVFSDERDGT